ncbi:MAG TPA: RNA repair domain-containing protein [Thermoplasmata archaeon]|nr:RNA repair domain-containing protein [Thermoplasmata archaeon]
MARTAREVLNELRWKRPDRLSDALLWYRDRTQTAGFRTIRGSEIVDLERRYFTAGQTRLPYYKIQRIECAGEVLFDRGTR